MLYQVKNAWAVGPRIFDRTEAIWKVGTVFEGLELRLGIRVVIGDVRAAMGLGNIQIDQQGGDRLGSHTGAAFRVQGEPTAFVLLSNVVYGDVIRRRLFDDPTPVTSIPSLN